jgi:hypothetical protein
MATFDTPKPMRLIQRILEICSDKDVLILDSFAGSGTTAFITIKRFLFLIQLVFLFIKDKLGIIASPCGI